MAGCCSTGQSLQRAVVLMEEEEEWYICNSLDPFVLVLLHKTKYGRINTQDLQFFVH
jgi:hypothetical protein